MKFDLRQARNYAGFSQKGIAKEINISTGAYQNYENGKRKMRVDVAKRFANVVGIPLEQIVF